MERRLPDIVMSYEYTVNIPADKRSTFRAMVKIMGGQLSRARKIGGNETPNAKTIAAMREAESNVALESFDLEAFHKMISA